MKDLLFDKNLAKIHELLPEVWWAGEMWLNECLGLNLQFKILEAYRTPERQLQLFAIGRRGKKGEIPVTYVRFGNHQRRIAIDIKPLNCTYYDIEQVAASYGITHPFTKGSFIDLAHFEFDQVVRRPSTPTVPLPQLSPEAEKKAFARGLRRLPEGQTKERAATRFRKRYGVSYESVL